MGRMFKNDGTLKIPMTGEAAIPGEPIEQQRERLIVREAYCAQGHSLMSSVQINNRPGIEFIYTDLDGTRSAQIVISSYVGDCSKTILHGEPFADGEVIRVLCPACRTELPILLECECGAPIYLFFIDKTFNHHFGQSFCSRIGCVRASRLRFSKEMLSQFMADFCF